MKKYQGNNALLFLIQLVKEAINASKYILPTADRTNLGGVKVGTNISVSSGTISVPDGTTTTRGAVFLTDMASSSSSDAATPKGVQNAIVNKIDKEEGMGLSERSYTEAEQTKLGGIEAGANKYTLPTASASVLGGVKVGTNISVSSGTISVVSGTTSAKGVVQLSDTAGTSTTTAATPNGVQNAINTGNAATATLSSGMTSWNNYLRKCCNVVTFALECKQNFIGNLAAWSSKQIATLPVGYRPAVQLNGIFINHDSGAYTDCYITITSSGVVSLNTRAIPTNWASLGASFGMRFTVTFVTK